MITRIARVVGERKRDLVSGKEYQEVIYLEKGGREFFEEDEFFRVLNRYRVMGAYFIELRGSDPSFSVSEVVKYLKIVSEFFGKRIRIRVSGVRPKGVERLLKHVEGFLVDLSFTWGNEEGVRETLSMVDGMPLTMYLFKNFSDAKEEERRRVLDCLRGRRSLFLEG